MNDYTSLAQSMVNSGPNSGPQPDVSGLPKYLRTAAGKNAMRAAVDSMISQKKAMGVSSPEPYKELIKTLLAQMGTGSASAAKGNNPMPQVQDPNRQVSSPFGNSQAFQQLQNAQEL